nr:GNAT family protein [Chromobacterium alticapitis]
MELNRIEAQVHPDNLASLRLLQRLDFQQEGRARQAGFWLGRYQDLIYLSLLRQDSALAAAEI